MDAPEALTLCWAVSPRPTGWEVPDRHQRPHEQPGSSESTMAATGEATINRATRRFDMTSHWNQRPFVA